MSGRSTSPVVRREETAQRPSAYSGGHFFEIHIGDVYQGHYIVVDKLGYGMQATVWLVHDSYKDRYFAMKVLSTECYCYFEVEVLKYLGSNKSQDLGHEYVSNLVDSFSKESAIGTTVFLIFDVMAETLPQFMSRIEYKSPEKMMKRFVKQLLLALDHAHKSGVIHTDIKPDNIMVQLPNESVIKDAVTPWKSFKVGNKEPNFLYWPDDNSDLMRRQHGIDYPMMLNIEPMRQTSFGMGDFYLDDDVSEDDILSLNVSLCDWGLASWTDQHLYEEISNITMKSPEVLLGAPWDTKTDIWSLGIVIFEVLSKRDMFNCVKNETQYRYLTDEEREEQMLKHEKERELLWVEKQEVPQADDEKIEFRKSENRYDLGVHLNEIVTIIEPFSPSLLDSIGGGKGQSQYLKSLFSSDGTIWGYEEYNRPPLEDHFPHIPEGEDKENFLDLLYKMMRVDPKDRASAEELLKEPWLQDVDLKEEVKTPLSPLPTPLPEDEHEQFNLELTDADIKTEGQVEADVCNESTTFIPDCRMDFCTQAAIDNTNYDDDNDLVQIDSGISNACTKATMLIPESIAENVAHYNIDNAVCTKTACPLVVDGTSPSSKTCSLSQNKGKTNAGKKKNKKNKKRKRGGKR